VTLLNQPCLLASPDGGQTVDLEPLCRGVIAEMMRRRGWQPEPDDYDQALAELLLQAVVIGRRYDPTRGGPFRAYLYDRLRHRFDDYRRTWEGRRGQKRPMLDDFAAEDVPEPDEEHSEFPWHRLGRASRALARMLLDERTRTEIADHFGLTETALDRRLQALREELAGLGLRPALVPDGTGSFRNDDQEEVAA
jgi:DNA-directed RNA polymerase specialized sigma24 family protein